MEFIIGFLVLAIILVAVSIWYASTHFHTVYYRLSSDKISKPVKFVLLSDLHDKTYGKDNQILLAAIQKEAPDAILIAGDMLTAALEREKAYPEKLCKRLAQKTPVYYSLGNHEAKMKWSLAYYQDAYAQYVDALKGAGVTVLTDSFANIPNIPIRVYGLDLEKCYYKRVQKTPMSPSYLDEKLGKLDDSYYNVLLAHNPEYFTNYAKAKIDLVLSGHLHGGLVRLPFLGGVIAPSLHLFPKYDGGRFVEKDTTMIVSRGLAFHNLGIRMWNQGELVVITILPTKE